MSNVGLTHTFSNPPLFSKDPYGHWRFLAEDSKCHLIHDLRIATFQSWLKAQQHPPVNSSSVASTLSGSGVTRSSVRNVNRSVPVDPLLDDEPLGELEANELKHGATKTNDMKKGEAKRVARGDKDGRKGKGKGKGKRIHMTIQQRRLMLSSFANAVLLNLVNQRILKSSEWEKAVWAEHKGKTDDEHFHPDVTPKKFMTMVTDMRLKFKTHLLLTNKFHKEASCVCVALSHRFATAAFVATCHGHTHHRASMQSTALLLAWHTFMHGAHSAVLAMQHDSAHVQRTAQLAQRAQRLMNGITNG
eukprot:CAMPEP_0167819810 /NCGR_PEP_ID=MMETSP0112_2-20121227/5653_1 /TAXON_ID=91324 /ORGANISM="Lotharella globosa, Strain CCCM811" /LENGTH=302 /DNA_ID=CAMNT_0007720119 /DNA_START=77 /DNA_END=982 /DNA_ORIENTATION=-